VSAMRRWEERIGERERRVQNRHNPIESGGGGGDNGGMDVLEPRVAVLEQIASDTRDTLKRMETDTRDALKRIETRLDRVDDRHDRDFRLTFGAIITTALGLGALMLGLLGVVAHGFKWF